MKKMLFLAISLCIYTINICSEIYTYTIVEDDGKMHQTIFLYNKSTNECDIIPSVDDNMINDVEALVEFYLQNKRKANPDDHIILNSLIERTEYFAKPIEERIPYLMPFFDTETKTVLSNKEIFFNVARKEVWTLIYDKRDVESNFLLRKANDQENKIFIKIMAIKKALLEEKLKKNH